MFRMMFGSLPILANIIAETKFCFTESKNVSSNSEFFVGAMFPSLPYVSDVSRKLDFPI